jgi:hypothetical protein
MLSEVLNITKPNSRRKFQILFLRNDPSQGVEVQEVKHVDFFTVREHLEHGESVFITSKGSQKIQKKSPAHGSMKTKLVTAFTLEGA